MALCLYLGPYKHIHNRKKCTCGTPIEQAEHLHDFDDLCMTPRSAPHRESSNCETIALSCTLNQASVVAHNGHVTRTSCNNELQLWDRGCLLPVCTRNCWTCTTDIEHRVNGLQLRNHNDLENNLDHERSLCVTTGMSTTLTCNNGHDEHSVVAQRRHVINMPITAPVGSAQAGARHPIHIDHDAENLGPADKRRTPA